MSKRVDDVVAQMLDSYERRTRKSRRPVGPGNRIALHQLPTELQKICAAGAPYERLLQDFFCISLAAGEYPIPVTQATLDNACQHLVSRGHEAINRPANWRTALRDLPPYIKPSVLGSDDWLERPRSPRRLNAPAGTFGPLEGDLDKWRQDACRDLQTVFDVYDPISPTRANSLMRWLLCAATRLLETGHITPDVRLTELLTQDNFDRWLDCDDDHSPTSSLAMIEAFCRVRRDLVGEDETVVHMRSQRAGRRDNNALPPDAVRELSTMLTPDGQQSADAMPAALMEIASRNVLAVHIRLALANVAAAIQAAIDYALRPGSIYTMQHDQNFGFTPITRLKKGGYSQLPESDRLSELLRQRSAIRKVLGAVASEYVMVTEAGALLGNRECCQVLSRTQQKFGLLRCPWQRFRDFAAARILQADPSAIMQVADLLEIKDPQIVLLRYAAIIPRDSSRAVGTDRNVGCRRQS